MKATVIICEYNPLTLGHIKHLSIAREETGCDTIICIMSGSFTQRGEAAILDKYTRARLAVSYGADIVIELPTIYAISPADNFAYGAMKMVSALPDVEYISFGSECGDIKRLNKIKDFMNNEPEDFKTVLNNYISNGNSYPKAYSLALCEYAIKHPEFDDIKSILDSPNNVLGISYMKAADKLSFNVNFHTMKRENNDSNDEITGDYPSATSIRKAIRREQFEMIKQHVSELCYNELLTIKSDGSALNDLCLYKLKSISGYEMEKLYDMDVAGGLHNRIKIAADESVTYSDFLEKVKTKKYTMSKIKRIGLYALLDITQDLYLQAQASNPYYTILAAKKDRKDILAEINQSCVNVIVRYSDTNKVSKDNKPLIKLDFQAQGTLNLINRSQCFNKTTLFI